MKPDYERDKIQRTITMTERMVKIETEITHLKEGNEKQNKSLEQLHNKVDTQNVELKQFVSQVKEWIEHKNIVDDRQDEQIKNKAESADVRKLSSRTWTVGWAIVGSIIFAFISSIVTKIVGLW